MISFEMADMPNGQNITNDEFSALHEIVAQDWGRNYVISDAKDSAGDWFLVVERKAAEDSKETETYFRVDDDGDWGVLWERKEGRPAEAERPSE